MAESQLQLMLAGEQYLASDPELLEKRRRARELCAAINAAAVCGDADRLRDLVARLFGAVGSGAELVPPFHCDYGFNILAGAGLFINAGCVILDCAPVTIGDRVLIGPHVGIYAATHPVDPRARASGRESARPVTIGSDVWIGGGAILCPGVRIGDGSCLGAGSVVTRDVPAGVVAAGNPCHVLREVRAGDGPAS